jgi:hypothetical protein
MKILRAKNSSTKKALIIGLTILAIISMAVPLYVYAFNGTLFGWSKEQPTDSAINYEAPTKEQVETGNSTKQAFNDKYYSSTKNEDSTTDTAKPTTNEVSVLISSASQTPDSVQLRTTIQSIDDGKCKLTLAKDSQIPVVREVDTQTLGSYSTCKGFDIPVTELQAGIWSATVTYTGANSSGTITQNIEVRQ